MPRPRDRQTATGLLPRMEARPRKDGKTVSYRYHPLNPDGTRGKPINLRMRFSTGAACGVAGGNLFGITGRASIGLAAVGSHEFHRTATASTAASTRRV